MDTSHFKTPDSLYIRIHELFPLIIKNVKEHNVKESENKISWIRPFLPILTNS